MVSPAPTTTRRPTPSQSLSLLVIFFFKNRSGSGDVGQRLGVKVGRGETITSITNTPNNTPNNTPTNTFISNNVPWLTRYQAARIMAG